MTDLPPPPTGLRLRLLFGAVVVVVVAQFALKTVRYEPYPTLLLPGGAEQYVDDGDGLVYTDYETEAVGPDGRRTPFAFGEAFPEVPRWYWDRVIRDDLGLVRLGPRREPVPVGPVALALPTGDTTPAEQGETRAFVRHRVEALVGHPVDSLRTRAVRYRLRQDAGTRELVRAWRERSLPLHTDAR